MSNAITVDESILIWAFRYCLGRMTYAVADCVDNILTNWGALSAKTKHLMHKEILKAIADDAAGMEMDKRQWLRVIERYNQDN